MRIGENEVMVMVMGRRRKRQEKEEVVQVVQVVVQILNKSSR